MIRIKIVGIISFCTVIQMSCQQQPKDQVRKPDSGFSETMPIRDNVLTKEEQQRLTPDSIIAAMKEGNEKFVTNDLTARDHSEMIRKAADGQFPKAVVLSCLDSRVPVEDVFNEGIGDLFVGRVAGNVVNAELLGSMEFGCKVAGAKVIVVMGHNSCGAVKAAVDNVQLGNITSLVDRIKPAVAAASSFTGEKKSKNLTYVDLVATNNVMTTIEAIRDLSPILKEMELKGEIKIVGAMYDLNTGIVKWL